MEVELHQVARNMTINRMCKKIFKDMCLWTKHRAPGREEEKFFIAEFRLFLGRAPTSSPCAYLEFFKQG
jgi:hypothetical protein